MAMRENAHCSPPEAPVTEGEAGALPDMSAQQLRSRIAVLLDEVAALRELTKEKDALEDMVGQLRDANQNLVLATVNAQALRDEAEATNRRQNEFLAMLAHELRNPLAPISMAATLLEKVPDAPPQLSNLQTIISRQVNHMSRLLDDLLDAARISSGKITLLVQPVPFADIVEQAVETIQLRIDERQQRLHVDIPSEAIMLEGDQVRLTQVFSNLLINASKFTQNNGDIRFCAKRVKDTVVITVEDNGAGISQEVLPYIFDLFTQGPRSLARSEGGLGIGLNVVRNLIQMHGGKVDAHSTGPGSGSTFTVTLPVSSTPQPVSAIPRWRSVRPEKCRILLVEDNVDASNTLKSFLMLAGHTVSAAYTGTSGLAMANEHVCDVLICDIGLPGLDGFQLIRELRKSSGKALPLAIALSGYGQADDRLRAIAAGFDHYLVKPVDGNALLALIAAHPVSRTETAVL